MKKWKLLKSKTVIKNPWTEIRKNVYKLPNGKMIDDFYYLIRPDFATIIAVDEKENVILEKQYRAGVDKIVYGLIDGCIEKNETPQQTALREVKEETGYVGKNAKLLGVFDVRQDISPLKAYTVVVEIGKEKTKQKLDITEEIEVIKVPLKKVYQMIEKGQITDISSVVAMSLYKSIFDKPQTQISRL